MQEHRKEISLKNEQIEADLRMSRELQQALLPVAYPSFSSSVGHGAEVFRFSHYYRPVAIVGGDFFHIKRVSDKISGVFIADVMGHGVRSALITALLRGILEGFDQEFMDPAELLKQVNRELTRILKQAGNGVIFATALYILVDAENRTIRHANAAHPLPLLVCKERQTVEPLDHLDSATVLGLFEDWNSSNQERSFQPDDYLILYTDGIIEVENAEGQEFGLERLCETVRHSLQRTMDDIFQTMLAEAGAFSTTGQFTDDICLVAIGLT